MAFVVSLVMAWSPSQRANAGIIWVEQPRDYANPIPTTPATGPRKGVRRHWNTGYPRSCRRSWFDPPRRCHSTPEEYQLPLSPGHLGCVVGPPLLEVISVFRSEHRGA